MSSFSSSRESAIRPFKVAVSEEALADLRQRLAMTRLPDTTEKTADGWENGTNLPFLRKLLDHWQHSYDWRKHEAALNAFPQFITTINSIDLHFYHIPSPRADAVPLLLLHGWPGSVYEFQEAMKLLSSPSAAEPAFHLVVPSLPGYGFSSAAKTGGMDTRAMAAIFVQLMALLGYRRYICQGGDWGSLISMHVAALDKPHCAAIHLNFLVGMPPSTFGKAIALLTAVIPGINRLFYTQKDLDTLQALQKWQKDESAYQQIQGTKPQTLSYSLVDSPAGLAAWITEKFHRWSDCGGEVEKRFSLDQLLTNISIYWFTGSMASAVRLYCESMRSRRFGPIDEYLPTPTGCLAAAQEIMRLPRPWLEANFNVVHYSELPVGGHFLAMEEPLLFAADIRLFAKTVAPHLNTAASKL